VAGAFRIEPIGAIHNRKEFACGVVVLDRYLRELATQDIRRRISNCFVACDDTNMVVAYYTFAATGIPLTDIPPDDAKRLPRYALLPAGLIGRLAVDQRFHGQRLGGALVIDAARRAAAADPAIYALVVDAKGEGRGGGCILRAPWFPAFRKSRTVTVPAYRSGSERHADRRVVIREFSDLNEMAQPSRLSSPGMKRRRSLCLSGKCPGHKVG
jgi:hypothetical protein